MTFLEELNTILTAIDVPLGFGVFPEHAGSQFIVYYPMDDQTALSADDDQTLIERHEARIGIYVRNADYEPLKNTVKAALIQKDFTVTSSRYVDFENSTGYHHYNIDAFKLYYGSED
jgi:hypothetical protein